MSRLLQFCILSCASLLPLLPAQDGKAPPSAGVRAAEAAASRATPTNLTVGVVDLSKAFDLYPRTIKERAKLQQLAQAFDDQIKETERRANELKELIANLKEGSRERNQKVLEYELAMQTRRAQAQLFDDEMRAETARMQLAIYEDLEIAVRQLAKERGLHLVLRIDADDKGGADGEKAGSKQVTSRLRAFDARQVLFAADELDLTPALIKLLQVPLETPKAPVPPAPQGNGKDGK